MVYFPASPLLKSPLREIKPSSTQKKNRKPSSIFSFPFLYSRKSEDGEQWEPTSPKLSCIGQVREKQKPKPKPKPKKDRVVNPINQPSSLAKANDKANSHPHQHQISTYYYEDVPPFLPNNSFEGSDHITTSSIPISHEIVEETWVWRNSKDEPSSKKSTLLTIVPKRSIGSSSSCKSLT